MTITGKKYVECTILGSSGAAAEAEDSSYDSDYEAEDNGPPLPHNESNSNNPGTSDKLHPDVSRTSSDTLAAEFAEYVTLHSSARHSPPAASTTPGTTKVPITTTPGYTARVEFALKLGYTEPLVQAALEKLGPEPAQNELLAELIRLGTVYSPKLADTADAAEALLPVEVPLDAGGKAANATTTSTQEVASPQPHQVQLRPIVIDGSNVAMSHGNREAFSCRGIKICVDWFRARGHQEITVFVPKWRMESSSPDNPVLEPGILTELERERLLVFTPSRLIGGKRMMCYDDRYILRLAAELDGIVVSNDNYRDLAQESSEFRKVVEERILVYSFINDRFMPPDDPLGRNGPSLDNFLKFQRAESVPACPYAKKCTYGNKCKFRHPERGPHPHKSVTERLVEHAQRHLQARAPSLSLPLGGAPNSSQHHQSLSKTKSWALSTHSSPTPTANPMLDPEFFRSRSAENVANESSSPTIYANSKISQEPQAASMLGWVAPRVPNSEPEPANMHRKLQRQLSLNPSCDTRLNQFQRYDAASNVLQQQNPHKLLQNQSQIHSVLQHRTLLRHDSYPASTNWEQQQQQQRRQIQNRQQHHQHVTRIASAPDSLRNLTRQTQMGGNNLNNAKTSMSLLRNLPSDPPSSGWIPQQQLDARRHLHYHLANIFPEEQVRAAMALHPHETNPQQICAAILSMFPKH